jgi:hypothetical protein
MIVEYNSDNFGPVNSQSFTILLFINLDIPLKRRGVQGGVPLGVPLPKKDHVTNLWILSTCSPLKLKGFRACPPRIYSPRSDPSKTDGGSRGGPLGMPLLRKDHVTNRIPLSTYLTYPALK